MRFLAMRIITVASLLVTALSAQTSPGELRVFDGMYFVWVPAGEFRMGSDGPEAAGDEQPLTHVRISQGFYLGKYEVTRAQWGAVMGEDPSIFNDCDYNCPVNNVSWSEVQHFIRLLNGRAGRKQYRLPTEAEWEYAARAGKSGDRYGELDDIAWYLDNSISWEVNRDMKRTFEVGVLEPNAWGLHDMLGNVYEWVQDRYDFYPGGSVTDPRGPVSGSKRVIRGGSYASESRYCRASHRNSASPVERSSRRGFRLLRTK